MKQNMLSIKFFFTSMAFLMISLHWLFDSYDAADFYSAYFYPCIFFVAFLVFFILGWVVKDKPSVPENSSTEPNDKNKSE